MTIMKGDNIMRFRVRVPDVVRVYDYSDDGTFEADVVNFVDTEFYDNNGEYRIYDLEEGFYVVNRTDVILVFKKNDHLLLTPIPRERLCPMIDKVKNGQTYEQVYQEWLETMD